jgi:hypothetical protein
MSANFPSWEADGWTESTAKGENSLLMVGKLAGLRLTVMQLLPATVGILYGLKEVFCQAQWLMYTIPAIWEADRDLRSTQAKS